MDKGICFWGFFLLDLFKKKKIMICNKFFSLSLVLVNSKRVKNEKHSNL